MRICKFCDNAADENARICPSCGGNDFKRVCDNCGEVIEKGFICSRCGVRAGQNKKVCPQCGNAYYTNACPNCGYIGTGASRTEPPLQFILKKAYFSQNGEPSNSSKGKPKSKAVALLLCVFLGFYGAHKFYEENVGMGFLYMFTGGLFLIGWIADIIALAKKPSTYYV